MRPPVGSVWAAAGNAPDSVPHSAVVARSVRRAVKGRKEVGAAVCIGHPRTEVQIIPFSIGFRESLHPNERVIVSELPTEAQYLNEKVKKSRQSRPFSAPSASGLARVREPDAAESMEPRMPMPAEPSDCHPARGVGL
jgi:hypothetical protein